MKGHVWCIYPEKKTVCWGKGHRNDAQNSDVKIKDSQAKWNAEDWWKTAEISKQEEKRYSLALEGLFVVHLKKDGVDKDENEGSCEKDKERNQRNKSLRPTNLNKAIRLGR